MVDVQRSDLVALCRRILLRAGATKVQSAILAEATVQAELLGHHAVGLSHLFDYVDGFRTHRIATTSTPSIQQLTSVVSAVDCRGGLAQHGFELALPGLSKAADEQGVAVTGMRRCFTAGELDYYVRLLNRRGLMGFACANSPALMTVAGAHGPLLGSNPHAFGVPLPNHRRLAVDQASSAAAWVSLREAAIREEPIPTSWAVDSDGAPTSSASAALEGALLPFGGYKGGNVALLVELLTTLAGGKFSTDAPPFNTGSASPSVGMVIVAVSTAKLDPDYLGRLDDQLDRWRAEHGADTDVWTAHQEATSSSVPSDLYERMRELADMPDDDSQTSSQ